MSVAKAKIKMKLLRAVTAVFVAATLFAFVPFSPVRAADPKAKNESCSGTNITTDRKSPFEQTSGMCLGTDKSDSNVQYYQFAVTFDNPVGTSLSNTIAVNGRNGNNERISFIKVNDKLWVSSYANAEVFYSYSFAPGTSASTCPKGPLSKITITAAGNGATQSFPIELCNNIGNDKSLLYSRANLIPSDDSTVSTSGLIRGNFGVQRNTDDESLKQGLLQKRGVTSIKLTKTAGDGKGTEVNADSTSSDSLFTLFDGQFYMNADAGTYKFEMIYNDAIVVTELPNGTQNITASDYYFVFENVVVPPGGTVWLAGDASTPYILSTNDSYETVVNTPPATTTCVVDGVGWIVCAVTNFMADIADSVYGLISIFLKTPQINTNTSDTGNGVYNAWAIMRSLANVVFVIMFMIIIFAQLTGQGVSNYGVKKTLPRLIVAAILVNLSFWISAIAVDASNILGGGLYDLLRGIVENMNVGIGTSWVGLITALLAGAPIATALTGASVAGIAAIVAMPGAPLAIVFLAIPIVLGAVLAVLTAALILIARQALTVILIIISPLAFVALLLPNTQKLFDKWRSMMTTLLLMYPIMSLIFGGSQIAGFAMLASVKTMADPTQILVTVLGSQAMMVLPFFFLIPIFLKFAGGGLDKLAANIMSRGQKLIGGVSGMARKEGMARMGRAYNQTKYGAERPGGIGGALRSIARRGGRALDRSKDSRALLDKELAGDRQDSLNEALYNKDGSPTALAIKSAGGDVAAGRRLAQRAKATADSEALKTNLGPLQQELARKQPHERDQFLAERAVSLNHSEGERAAARQQLAALGRDGVIANLNQGKDAKGRLFSERRALDSTHEDYINALDFDNEATKSQFQANMQESIDANGGSLVKKAPSQVKGEDAAFTNPSADDIRDFSTSEIGRFHEYMERQRLLSQAPPNATEEQLKAAKAAQGRFASATNAFNVALEQAANDSTYVIKPDAGIALASAASPEVRAALAPGLKRINSQTGAIIRGATSDTSSAPIQGAPAQEGAPLQVQQRASTTTTAPSGSPKPGPGPSTPPSYQTNTPDSDSLATPEATFTVEQSPSTPAATIETVTQKAVDSGVYRVNSSGAAIRPAGSKATNMKAVEEARKQNPAMTTAELKQFMKDNEKRAGSSGAQLSDDEKRAIDARIDEIVADFETRENYKAAHPDATDEEIQNAGDGVFGKMTNEK